MAELVAKRYASALFEVGEESNKLNIFLDELKSIKEILEMNDDFFKILNSPLVSKSEKRDMIDNVFTPRVEVEMSNFLKILVDKDRMKCLMQIFDQYKKIVNENNNIQEATVVTTIALTDKQINDLTEKLSSLTNKKVIVTNEIDNSIIGGVLIKMGYEEIDGTVKTRLENMKKELSQIIA